MPDQHDDRLRVIRARTILDMLGERPATGRDLLRPLRGLDNAALLVRGDLVLDDLKTDMVEVKLWGEGAGSAFPAVKEECYIEIVSYGGDTTGYQIPFNVHYTGVKTAGTFDPATKTFTETD